MKIDFNRRKIGFFALACTTASGLVWANVDGAVPLPTGVDGGLPVLKLVGRTRLRVFGFRIYDAQLWVASGFSRAAPTDTAFVVDLTYLRALKGNEIAKRSLSEIQDQAALTSEQAERWLAFMAKTFPDVGDGDRLLGIHQADKTTRFVLNGKEIGRINEAAFGERFFAIWLSPKSSEPAMRDALLAGVK